MKQYFNIAYHSLKNHGVRLVLNRLVKYSTVRFKRLFQKKDIVNLGNWQKLKNKYSGKRVFIIGNGPSLNETPLYLLKDEYKLCFNHFDLMFDRLGWLPDFYMVTDDMVIKDVFEIINTVILPEVQYGFFPDLHPNNTNFKDYVKERENVLWLNTDNPNFSIDLPKCGINNTVVNAGLQVMAYLGFSEIYLLGVDASYSFASHKVKNINKRDLVSEEDDPNHFDPRYFGKGKKYHYQPMYEMVRKFEIARVFFSTLGIKIYNAGMGGKLEVFERKDIYSLMNSSKEKQFDLFCNSINPNIDKNKIRLLLNERILSSFQEFSTDLEYFYMEYDSGLKIIPKVISTHIPFGPFDNKYLFIQRESKMLENNHD
jgi:hypothetical protein